MIHIPRSECVDRALYRIHSRNLVMGVFRAETGGFLGLREKFGSIYVFEEYHWDNGPPYGTVHPLEALPEVLPPEIKLAEGLGSECSVCNTPCEYVLWPDGGEREIALKDGGGTMLVPGAWNHLAQTGCQEVCPVGVPNKALHDWLVAMESKHVPLENMNARRK